jgi:beta-1,4-mannosyltransferase
MHDLKRDELLNVFMLPLGPDNPYQTKLIKALECHDVKIKGTSKVFFINDLLKFRPDVIHFHWLQVYFLGKSKFRGFILFILFLFQFSIIKLYRIPIVWTVHNLVNHEKKSLILDRIVSTLVAKTAKSIIAHSESAKKRISEYFKGIDANKIMVINHGHFLDDYESDLSKSQARTALSLSQDDFVLLFLGQIRAYKGVSDLIDAFSSLTQHPNLRLLIAGKPHNKELQDQINAHIGTNKHIQFIPTYIPDNEIGHYFAASDVSVLPYKSILTSGALVLAMGFAKPVIIPNISSLMGTAATGAFFTYPTNDIEGLKSAILTAFANKEALAKQGLLNGEKAHTFTWESVAWKTNQAYRQKKI